MLNDDLGGSWAIEIPLSELDDYDIALRMKIDRNIWQTFNSNQPTN
jgi:hypothetical protein